MEKPATGPCARLLEMGSSTTVPPADGAVKRVGYGDPDAFYVNLNACIQTFRTVTWIMRKEKGGVSTSKDTIATPVRAP